jgi:hypothetical protein
MGRSAKVLKQGCVFVATTISGRVRLEPLRVSLAVRVWMEMANLSVCDSTIKKQKTRRDGVHGGWEKKEGRMGMRYKSVGCRGMRFTCECVVGFSKRSQGPPAKLYYVSCFPKAHYAAIVCTVEYKFEKEKINLQSCGSSHG